MDFPTAKKTLVLGIKKDLRLQSCQPSAHYRLVFSSSCPGKCHYCYLATGLGPRIYLRLYVNLEEIQKQAAVAIQRRKPQVTRFEASSSSDPLAMEHLSGALQKFIPFFAQKPPGRLRIATKFTHIQSLVPLEHQGRTRVRFSINTPSVINNFEEETPSLEERIKAGISLARAQYPVGFLIAPLLRYPQWEKEYFELLKQLAARWKEEDLPPPSFELIMLRLTRRGQKIIQHRYPHTQLHLDLTTKEHKGFGKYVYPKEEARQLQRVLEEAIGEFFPHSTLEYFT